ncbi:unnamed protein product [Chironomus riparius]|uniref:Cytoplasmic tRNA 2-thiolation protein 2 n=1 Tax=Chironomus riparius TaxID=315576 RepID=A0A9N9RMN3_9DIPT|nr:unnamed protein product [Chironomus riparius]
MCSVAEADFGDEGGKHTMLKDVALNAIEDENCKKCNVDKCVIKLDFKEAMCLSCFLYYVRHKFRATLGSSKILNRQSDVLFDFKGTAADVCLLHMIKFAFEEETYKRLSFKLKLVFVDENCTATTNTEDALRNRMTKIQEIKDILQQFPSFTCCYSTIADKIFDDISIISREKVLALIESEKEFSSVYHSIDTLSSKQDFMEIMRKNALRDTAHHLNCSYIFLSDISVDLAKKLISNIALGRGSSVSNDVGFLDDRISCIKIIRPLKDLNQHEVDSYVQFNNLKFCSFSNFSSNDNVASIQNLTSNFINQLQKNCYNSTVSTVYKCSNKIASNNETISCQNNTINSKMARSYITDMNQRCLLCKSILDYHHSETLYAIEFSRCVSGQIAANIEGMENLERIRESSENAKNSIENNRNKFLCHGCRNIFPETNQENFIF